MLKLFAHRWRKILGVMIVCEGATELIHIGQMALITQSKVDIFVENILISLHSPKPTELPPWRLSASARRASMCFKAALDSVLKPEPEQSSTTGITTRR